MRAAFELQSWAAVGDADRVALARDLARQLPARFEFVAVRTCELGGQRHPVAFFSHRGAKFALVPGGTAQLGYDPAIPFYPTPEQLRSWEATAAEYVGSHAARGLPPFDTDLNNYLRGISSPLRTAVIQPFLMEVVAREAGTERMPLDAPEVREWAERRAGQLGQVENAQLRVRFGPDGPVAAYRVRWMTGAEVRREVAAEGFRLPTADEFEYACRAGSRTLFRWGNTTPEEEPNPLDETPAWSLHWRPSAFGVHIAHNPYAQEFVAEPDIMCGGDGGCLICAGHGSFVSWLTLSSAYRDASWGDRPTPRAHFRRVLPLR